MVTVASAIIRSAALATTVTGGVLLRSARASPGTGTWATTTVTCFRTTAATAATRTPARRMGSPCAVSGIKKQYKLYEYIGFRLYT